MEQPTNRILQGQEDIPLNQLGEQQAKEAAKKLKHIKFDLAFSSDLLRAKRTTEVIAMEHKLAVATTKLLRERYFGHLQGRSSELFHEYNLQLQSLTDEKKLQSRIIEDAENDEEVIARIITFLREAAVAYPDKTILVGTHAGILRLLLIHLGFTTYEHIDSFKIENASYIKLTSDGVDFFIKDVQGIRKKDTGDKQTF